MSEKGGVAKTITVANLGPALAAHGLRVLLVDFDPQGDLSASFGIEHDAELVRVEDLLAGTHDDADAALLDVAPTGLEGRLWLLAASRELRGQTARLLRGAGDGLAGLLDAIDTPTDVVLVDTPAGETIFAAQAIVAAQEIIVMVLPGYHELRALTRLLDSIDRLSEAAGSDVSLLGVLIANADARWRTTRDYAAHLAAEDLPLFGTVIPRRQAVTAHARYGAPTILLEPGNAVAHAYAAVAGEIVDRLALAGSAP